MIYIRLAVGIAAFVGAQICAFWSMSISYKMIGEVNAKIEPSKKFKPYFWWYGKHLRLKHEYQRLYPQGGFLRRRKNITILFFSLVIIVGLCIFLPR